MNEAQINATTNPAAGLTQAAEREDRRVLRLVLFDALASEAMGTLTTGVFLVGFAVALGADNFAIGVLAAVPFFAQLLQIPAVLLVERWRVRRDICVFSTAHRSRVYRWGSGCTAHWRFARRQGAHRLACDLSSHGSDRRLRLEFMDARSRSFQRTRTLFWTAHGSYNGAFGGCCFEWRCNH